MKAREDESEGFRNIIILSRKEYHKLNLCRLHVFDDIEEYMGNVVIKDLKFHRHLKTQSRE